MRFSWLSAIVFATSVVAQDVSFGTSVGTGTIRQVYGKLTDPLIGSYYDTVKPSLGGLLVVNFLPFRRRAIVVTGTPFDFIPTKSAYMGYVSTEELVYGHLALSENNDLHLTVGRLSTEPVTSPGPVPFLAKAILKDGEAQVSQFWSLDTTTGVLTFLNLKSGVYPIVPASLAPVKPVSPPEPVHLTNSWNTPTGIFYFNKLTTPPCVNEICPL